MVCNPKLQPHPYVIDRRFYRRKYGTEKTIANFATLTRQEVEIARLTDTLPGVVDETIRPEIVSLSLEPVQRKMLNP